MGLVRFFLLLVIRCLLYRPGPCRLAVCGASVLCVCVCPSHRAPRPIQCNTFNSNLLIMNNYCIVIYSIRFISCLFDSFIHSLLSSHSFLSISL
ncbi:MAG: hypothetical protein J3R72DRAFT_441596 [Linnemannia gamsii]|nr:MAG: hypothetical protein J3R72DRAFT_441596 [Linnemannia gamsii]